MIPNQPDPDVATWYRRAQLAGGRATTTWPGLTAMLVRGGWIAWIGPDGDAEPAAGDATVDLDGALVLPGFTDAHVHATETGLMLSGPDLSGTRSVTQILDLVAAAARSERGRAVLGHGWDELQLAEGRPPNAAELDRAGAGAEVYLSRVDVHSAVVSGALADRAGLRGLPGWDGSGRVERDAHHAARHATRFGLSRSERRTLHLLALRSAAAAGLTEVHEMSAPHITPDEDLADLVALTAPPPAPATAGPPGVSEAAGALPEVVPYRGELVADEEAARQVVTRLADSGVPRLAGLAGDLMADGSFGSRTAALAAGYTDAPGHRGHLYLDPDQVRDHVVACTRTGLQAGFHVIGDAAVDAVLQGFSAAAGVVGPAAIRAARHRLEHLESPAASGVREVARLGLIASVQPGFDAAWGGPDRMYARRLGDRAARLNPFGSLVAAGVPLAFGSDSPVTPFGPWEAIRAALLHRTPEYRIGIGTALRAHTAGARAAGRGDPGPVTELRAGDPATFTCWRSPAISARVQAGGDGSGGVLADLAAELRAGDAAPQCVLTVIRGRVAARQG